MRLGLIEALARRGQALADVVCIRGACASASLKLLVILQPQLILQLYPRRMRLGLIEARAHGGRGERNQGVYPRRMRLGLIEAYRQWALTRKLFGRIRGACASASLKRVLGCGSPPESKLCIRGACASASLKRFLGQALIIADLGVSEAHAPRPH